MPPNSPCEDPSVHGDRRPVTLGDADIHHLMRLEPVQEHWTCFVPGSLILDASSDNALAGHLKYFLARICWALFVHNVSLKVIAPRRIRVELADSTAPVSQEAPSKDLAIVCQRQNVEVAWIYMYNVLRLKLRDLDRVWDVGVHRILRVRRQVCQSLCFSRFCHLASAEGSVPSLLFFVAGDAWDPLDRRAFAAWTLVSRHSRIHQSLIATLSRIIPDAQQAISRKTPNVDGCWGSVAAPGESEAVVCPRKHLAHVDCRQSFHCHRIWLVV
mmetsp:Transcript_13408/g.31917  ORF Transcript_13408/g.31917 Transcript_13408/m.31917 type:complete len:271 (-) Transcript_13408:641-1453(-)